MDSLHLAIASIPIQHWEPPYDSASALREGTIFPSLNLPFFVLDNSTKPTTPAPEGGGEHA